MRSSGAAGYERGHGCGIRVPVEVSMEVEDEEEDEGLMMKTPPNRD